MSWKSGNIAIFNRKKRFDCGVFALKTASDMYRLCALSISHRLYETTGGRLLELRRP